MLKIISLSNFGNGFRTDLTTLNIMPRSFIFPILIICFSTSSFCQAQNNQPKIQDLSDQLYVKLFGVIKSNVLRHYDLGTKTNIEYKPNENFNIGIGMGHKWLGFDLALNLGLINDDDAIFGETRRFDLQTSIYLKQFVFDLHYQRYKGYYASTPWRYLEGYEVGDLNFPLRPDIKTFNTALNMLYVFKPERFSYKAAFIYNQRQTKSGGSWLLGGYFNLYNMNADSTIVPESPVLAFDRSVDFRDVDFLSFGIKGGYGHTFTIKSNFFFSLSIDLGFGPAIKKYNNGANPVNQTETQLSVRGGFRTAIGINKEKVFYGISAISSNSTEVDDTSSHLSRGVSIIKLFYGRRFVTPKVVKKVIK